MQYRVYLARIFYKYFINGLYVTMTISPVQFEFTENLTVKKCLTKLSKKLDIQVVSQQYSIKSFYDSFDWRLYNADKVCEFSRSKTVSNVSLIDRNSGELIALEAMQDIPEFSAQFPSGKLQSYLAVPLEMRALLPLCQLELDVYRINILNKQQKTIVRLQIDAYESLNNRISLHPLKGYDKALQKVTDILQQTLGLKPIQGTVLNAALKSFGRKPKDYSSKLVIKLKPDMAADKASKVIYRLLLQTMKVNEVGTIADTDTEFLHDFRVAVRRTRAGLNQLKNVLPSDAVAKHAAFFAWLGQITGLTRDMDVYLLNYEKYRSALPLSLRNDIAPLYAFLKQKQLQAQKELAEKLNSATYKKQVTAWEQYLKQPLDKNSEGSHANLPIKVLADQRIWKVYKRILKDGKAIRISTPAEALHDLRKTCKKLRYLMEFFQSLYPEKEIKMLIKSLKNFQTVLGDFQDYEIQEIKLKQFSEEMMDNNVPSNTLLAMGVLVQYLDVMKCTARHDFSEQFAIFEQAENQATFKYMFAHKA